jgi:hypothetical protein
VSTQSEAPLDDGQIRIIEKVQKLLNLAAKNPNQQEAAAATAKAQALLTSYNLDISMVQRASGAADGRREEAKLRGGFYQYQRDLWKAVAKLNFCVHWVQSYYEEKTVWDPATYDEQLRLGKKWIKRTRPYLQKRHCIIGRIVNTTATRIMAQYLEDTIERITREQIKGDLLQKYSTWAVSFREGMVDILTDKLEERRQHLLDEEEKKRKAAERAAKAAGTVTTGRDVVVTIASVVQQEIEGNYDFEHGEGAYRRKKEQEAQWAREAKEEQDRYTAWAAAHPEEARKQEAERREANRKYWARRQGGRSGGGSSDKNRDYSAFNAGRRAAEDVGLDQQMSAPGQRKITHAKG